MKEENVATTSVPTNNKEVSKPANVDINNKINLFDEKQVVAAEAFLKKVMRSSKSGITSIEDGLAVLMRAQDLNLPFSTCLEHIHVINGKTGVDVHIIKALLLRAGVSWNLIKDYAPLYEYTDGINVYNDGSFPTYAVRCISKKEADEKSATDTDNEHIYLYPVKFFKDFNGNVYRNYQVSDKFQIVRDTNTAKQVASQGKVPIYRIPSQPVDYITEYEFTRELPNNKIMKANGKFYLSEAVAAGLLEKDTYQKYARILVGHRAFTYGARDIASDYLFGIMETTELKIVNNLDIDEQDIIDVSEVNNINNDQ